jgi:hypothetical protein
MTSANSFGRRMACAIIAAAAIAIAWSAPAYAGSAWWHVSSGTRPSYLPTEGEGEVIVSITNVGDATANAETSPLTITDQLPPNLKATKASGVAGGLPSSPESRGPVKCTTVGTVKCEFTGKMPPFEVIEVRIVVTVEPGAEENEVNHAVVSGGGTETATSERALRVSSEPPPFGVDSYEMETEEEGGAAATQAGSHPFQLTTSLTINQNPATGSGPAYIASPVQLPKDLNLKLPPGLIGNTTPFQRCTLAQFLTEVEGDHGDECPIGSAVGVAAVTYNLPGGAEIGTLRKAFPVFNLEPKIGEPARFGFFVEGLIPVTLDTSVRTGGDYGVTVSVDNIPQTGSILNSIVTFWGAPGDPRHNISRGAQCLREAREHETPEKPCVPSEETRPAPFLTLPTSCTGPLQAGGEADSWLEPKLAGQGLQFAGTPMPALDGCNRLPFTPSIKLTPTSSAASSPTGANIAVHVPQEGLLATNGLAESNVKDITVALPEGMDLNPSGAGGLEACSEAEIGYRPGESAPPSDLHFSSIVEEPFCPTASKVGTAEIVTPLLPASQHLKGSVYLAAQNQNPFGSLVAMYVVAEDPVSGVLVKLAGEVSLGENGQVTGIVRNNPQVAFEDAELKFFSGERAALTTPAHCGVYTTNASFTPWAGGATTGSSSSYAITTGPAGGACPGSPLPFAPSLDAGSTGTQAGAFTPFRTTLSRPDGDQALSAVSVHLPSGVAGVLTNVPLCGEAQANAGTCGAGSLIGEATVSAGVGGQPITVGGGKVYMTGPYGGAPFGLSIAAPAKAGPFDLDSGTPCDCTVVRARIEVDPVTAALTVATDTSGPFKIPTILKGVPLQIKAVQVTINRPQFTFNPTDCDPLSVGALASGAEGGSASPSVPLQVANCATLAFKPTLKASTSSKVSRLEGAALTTKLSYPKGSFGHEANIAKVKVELPKQLPSRLSTLQKACLAATFNANPAKCPAASIVGRAKVITPVLPVPLVGPAYFVSNGGEAFPSLTIVLQGYGVTVKLVGTTLIRKGITSTTFKSAPDVPFESFELALPRGRFSALGAPEGLCKKKLAMPTVFTAQNGAVIKTSTPISVSGCPKHKAAKKHAKKKH